MDKGDFKFGADEEIVDTLVNAEDIRLITLLNFSFECERCVVNIVSDAELIIPEGLAANRSIARNDRIV